MIKLEMLEKEYNTARATADSVWATFDKARLVAETTARDADWATANHARLIAVDANRIAWVAAWDAWVEASETAVEDPDAYYKWQAELEKIQSK